MRKAEDVTMKDQGKQELGEGGRRVPAIGYKEHGVGPWSP